MWTALFSIYMIFIRPAIKWIIRKVTGKCELLRITSDDQLPGAEMCYQVEFSLKYSKTPALKYILDNPTSDTNVTVSKVMKIKSVSPEVHPTFGPKLCICLQKILGYKQLINEVDATRNIAYSSDNPEHERLLMKLWTTLKPDTKLESRVSKQWGEVGFQGDDPMTDFRGMGLLGLYNMAFFVDRHTDIAKRLLCQSSHPRYGCPFGITCINISGMAVQLLNSGDLKTHFYNIISGKPGMEHFHEVFCYLMYNFNKFWIAEDPEDIMQFNVVKDIYRQQLIQKLKDKSTKLCI